MFKKTALLVTVPSDSHSWNLVFMEFLLSDLGYKVENLGPNTPMPEVVDWLNQEYCDMVVVSTVNGHGYIEGAELARRIRSETGFSGGLYLGGKICTENDHATIAGYSKMLKASGFDRVFDDSVTNSFDEFQELVTQTMPVPQANEYRAAI